MSYPRLIFANERLPLASDADAIADLKLDLIFDSEVSPFLLLKSERETLLLRREMFSLLLADGHSEKIISELADTLSEAETLYKAFTAAPSEKSAAFTFVYLFDAVAAFCEKARKTENYGSLFARFCSALADLEAKNDFVSAKEQLPALLSEINAVRCVMIKTDTETAKVQKCTEGGITEALRACAGELGIEINEKSVTPFALQKGLADAFGVVYPSEFTAAAKFLNTYRFLVTGELFEYIPELKFILGMLRFVKTATAKGLPYCFPELDTNKRIALKNVYDITLLKKEGTVIVPNDVNFSKEEPFFYLTGANGGGKTTYIRTVGSAVLMFLAGCPVFCESGSASLISAVFTHFPRDERFEGTGRFLDEKNRVDAMLSRLDGNCLVLLNETFATTGEEKAIEQTGILADTLYTSGNFGLYITHQHGVSKTEIPFLGVTVDENDSNRRTYKIEKRRLPPRSFAKDILQKYSLDKASLENRFLK